MATRKTKKKDTSAGANSFLDFMANATAGSSVVDLSKREDKFYKIGDYNIDRALGGGLPAGAIISITGPAGSGKSLVCLSAAKSVCKDGGRVAYFDTENKISKKAIKMMGFDDYVDDNGIPLFNHFTLSDNNLEEMIEKIMEFSESKFFKFIVIDSIDSLIADESLEKSTHDALRVGGDKARQWSQWLPAIVASIERSADDDTEARCSLVFVQQLRSSMNAYGNPETNAGGKALEYAPSVKLRIGSDKSLNAEEDGKLVYQGANCRIQKTTQGAVPKDAIQFRLYIGDEHEWGVDPIYSLVDEAIASRVVPPASPTSHMYIACDELCEMLGAEPGTLKFNGRNNLTLAIQDDLDFRDAVIELIDARADMEPEDFEDTADEAEIDFEEISE